MPTENNVITKSIKQDFFSIKQGASLIPTSEVIGVRALKIHWGEEAKKSDRINKVLKQWVWIAQAAKGKN